MGRKLILLAFICGGAIWGDTFSFTLSPSLIFAEPGDNGDQFQGSITEPASTPPDGYYLNGICLTFFSSSCSTAETSDYTLITLDDTTTNTFYNNVPGTYLPGDPTYNGPIFGVDVDPTIATGLYSGTAVLLGGSDQSTFNPFGSTAFQVDVVPEPRTWIVALAGLVGLLVWRRKAKSV
jgi:MYXO-CTERM domain-containing protein